MDPPPSGTVTTLSRRVLHGPNRWSRLPMIQFRVDLETLDASPSDRIQGLTEGLMTALPGLMDHGCSEGRPGGFETRLRAGTWMGHVVEHVALEFQRSVGARTTRGKTRAAGVPGVYDVVFAYEDEAVGLAAGDAAVELVNRLIDLQAMPRSRGWPGHMCRTFGCWPIGDDSGCPRRPSWTWRGGGISPSGASTTATS